MSGGDCCGFGGSGFGGVGGASPSGISVADEGVPISPDPFSTLNFAGNGVVASDAGGGTALITIPGETLLQNNVALPGAPHTTLNFTGGGVELTDLGAGTAKISIPGVVFADEGVPLANPPHTTVNFVGDGITAVDAGLNTATVTVPRESMYSPPELWVFNNVGTATPPTAMAASVSQNFDSIKMMRAGSIVGLATRLTETVTAGTLVVEVTLNGAGIGYTLSHTSVLNSDGGIDLQAIGAFPYAAGDLIGMQFTTDILFAPNSDDVEAWLQVVEAF